MFRHDYTVSQGKADKYTEYSHITGITKDHGQLTLDPQAHITSTNGTNTFPLPLKESLTALDIANVLTTQGVIDIQEGDIGNGNDIKSAFDAVLPALTILIRQFGQERDWFKYYMPRNLILALVGEVGELAEILQWKGDDDKRGTFKLTLTDHDRLSQELADVTIYVIRFADVFNV